MPSQHYLPLKSFASISSHRATLSSSSPSLNFDPSFRVYGPSCSSVSFAIWDVLTTDFLESPLRLSFYVTLGDDHPLAGLEIVRLGTVDCPGQSLNYLAPMIPLICYRHATIHLLSLHFVLIYFCHKLTPKRSSPP